MNIIQKIIGFFTKAKNKVDNFKDKVENFIDFHSGSIKVMMNIFQTIYEKGNGTAKMQQVVKTICAAVGAEKVGNEYADEITAFVEKKCQQIYDELVAAGGIQK